MFGSNKGQRAGSNGGRGDRGEPKGTGTTPAQMIQVGQKSRPRPIHIPPRHMNETPDESEPSYSYEEKSFLAYDKEEEVAEVVDKFHQRMAASGHRTGRGGSFGASSISNGNNHTGGSPSSSLLTRNLSSSENGSSGSLGGNSSGGSNFWRTTSRQPGSSSGTRSVGKNGRATSDGSSKNSRLQTSNKNYSNIKSRNSRRRLRSSGQSTKQIGVDNNYGKDEYKEGGLNTRVKSKDKNQKQPSGEMFGASRKLTGEAGNKVNISTQRFPHSNSASSFGSTGSNEARMKSKQRDKTRRLKLDAQQQRGEDGGIVDNGYYHEVPTMDMEYNSNINSNRGSLEYNSTMSALEEEMSRGDYTTDGSTHNRTDNDGSHSETTTNRVNRGGGTSSGSTRNFVSNSMPQSTKLASAAGAAAAAVSEYRHNSLTHHINNIRQSSPSYQRQVPGVPIHLNDNTDTRSTTSTMSDLSMTDSNTNRHQMSSPTSSMKKNSINSLNSLLNGKPVPIDSPTLSSRKNSHFQQQTPAQQQQQFHRQNQKFLQQHQRFPNAASNGDGVSSLTPVIAATIARNGGGNGAIGIELPGDIGNNFNSLGSRNVNMNRQDGSFTTVSDEFRKLPPNQNHSDALSSTGTMSTATSVTSTTFGINKGRGLQTPELSRHNSGKNTDNTNTTRRPSTDNSQLANKIAKILDDCESIRFPFKKKLMLNSLHMAATDIPVKDLYGTVLGQSLHKLSLSGNRLSTIPRKLVTCLPTLKSMDISQCELHQLPERWNLPQLRRLNLSHNRLSDFPEEVRFRISECLSAI